MSVDTALYGILGHNISYSKSPAIFSELFERYSIDAIYRRFDITKSALATFLDCVSLLPIAGFNVTIPYKEQIVKFLQRKDAIVTATGSANLVINRKGSLHGFNTDYHGIAHSIEDRLRLTVRGASVSVLGSGGAARTVVYYLARNKVAHVRAYHHSKTREATFSKYANSVLTNAAYESRQLSTIASDRDACDLWINCTPIPFAQLTRSPDRTRFKRIFELRYGGNAATRASHITGEHMLAAQAAENFRIMFNVDVPTESIIRILRSKKRD